MKDFKIETLITFAGIIFAAGMLYQKVESTGEKTRVQIEALEQRIHDQKESVKRIDEYLSALRRNGL